MPWSRANSACRILSAAREPLRCVAAYTEAIPPTPSSASMRHLPLTVLPRRALARARSSGTEPTELPAPGTSSSSWGLLLSLCMGGPDCEMYHQCPRPPSHFVRASRTKFSHQILPEVLAPPADRRGQHQPTEEPLRCTRVLCRYAETA